MNLVQVTHESITIGQPLPFSLRDESGALLARKGYVIVSREDLEAVRGRDAGDPVLEGGLARSVGPADRIGGAPHG